MHCLPIRPSPIRDRVCVRDSCFWPVCDFRFWPGSLTHAHRIDREWRGGRGGDTREVLVLERALPLGIGRRRLRLRPVGPAELAADRGLDGRIAVTVSQCRRRCRCRTIRRCFQQSSSTRPLRQATPRGQLLLLPFVACVFLCPSVVGFTES
jgi:hypothetical protein